MKITSKNFRPLVDKRYNAIGDVLFGDAARAEFTDGRDQFLSIVASNQALLLSVQGSLEALKVAGLIPADTHEGLNDHMVRLTAELGKAIRAQMILDGTEIESAGEVLH